MTFLQKLLFLLITTILFSCKKDVQSNVVDHYTKTENIIIIVMDGARYSETWGDNSHQYIPKLASYIKPKGISCDNFYNNGFTWTSPGHLAMVSGQYYNLNNGGNELPPFPTIFQYFNKTFPNKKSWLITSKDKLEVLTNTSDTIYFNQFLANTDCGINGLGTGYREDSITFHNAINILSNNNPNLALINFKQPDAIGHTNDWAGYLNQISIVDDYIYQLFNLIETHPFYKDKTTVFITNDHGRHDNNNGGFQNHGDSCEGCRHLMFFAYGPDFYENTVISTRYELIDIPTTIASLLKFNLPNSKGVVMKDLYKPVH